MIMRQLSIGSDSTLGNWIKLCTAFFGEDSVQVEFLQNKAKTSPNGLEEEVMADEQQLLYALINMKEEEDEQRHPVL